MRLAQQGTAEVVGYWSFDTLSNSEIMLTGNQVASGVSGNALVLDGQGECVAIAHQSAYDLTEQMTVSFWFKTDTMHTWWQHLVSKGGEGWGSGWRVQRYIDSGRLAAICGPDETHPRVVGRTRITDKQWHHVALVNDGLGITLYVDGSVDGYKALGTEQAIHVNQTPIVFGAHYASPEETFTGMIDEVILFDRALSGDEIGLLHQKKTGWLRHEISTNDATDAAIRARIRSRVADVQRKNSAVTSDVSADLAQSEIKPPLRAGRLRALGSALAQKGRANEADALLQQFKVGFPDHAGLADFKLEVANALVRAGESSQADRLYQEVVSHRPGEEIAYAAGKRLFQMRHEKNLAGKADILEDLIEAVASKSLHRSEVLKLVRNRAFLLRRQGRVEETVDLFKPMVSRWSNTTEGLLAYRSLIAAHLRLGDVAAAEAAVSAVLASNYEDTFGVAWTMRMFALQLVAMQGRTEKAFSWLDHTVEHFSGQTAAIWAHHGRATLFIQLGRLEEAQAEIELIRSQFTGHPKFVQGLGILATQYQKTGRLVEAKNLYQETASADPDGQQGFNAAYQTTRLAAKTTQASQALQKFISSYAENPNLSKSLSKLLPYYKKIGKNELAIQTCKGILKHDAGSDSARVAHVQLMALNIRLKDKVGLDAAVSSLIAALPSYGPRHMRDLSWRARQMAVNHQLFEQSQALCQALLETWPDHKNTFIPLRDLTAIAIARADDDAVDKLTKQLESSYGTHPKLPDAYCGFGNRFEAAGRPDKASECYQQVIDRWPDSAAVAKAQKQLALLQWRREQVAAGSYRLEDLVSYFEQNPNDNARNGMLVWYGDYLDQVGESEKAQPYFQQVIDLAPESPEGRKALVRMATSRIRQSRHDQSRQLVETLMEHHGDDSSTRGVLTQLVRESVVHGSVQEATALLEPLTQQSQDVELAAWASKQQLQLGLDLGDDTLFATSLQRHDNTAGINASRSILSLGRRACEKEKYEYAKQLFHSVRRSRSAPRQAQGEAIKGLAVCYLHEGDQEAFDNAVESLMKMADGAGDSPRLVFEIGKAAEGVDMNQASAVYEQVSEAWPQHPVTRKARDRMAMLEIQRGTRRSAEEIIERHVAAHDDPQYLAESLVEIGQMCMKQFDLEKAQVAFGQALELSASVDLLLEAQQSLVRIALEQNDAAAVSAGLEALKDNYAAHAKCAAAVLETADTLRRAGWTVQARQLYQWIMDRHTGSVEAVRSHLRLAYEQDRAVAPPYRNSYDELLEAYRARSDIDVVAIHCVEDHYENARDDDDLEFALYVSDFVIDKLADIRRTWVISHIHLFKAYCLNRLGRSDEALATIDTLVERWPKFELSSYAHQLAGELYLKQAQVTERPAQVLEKALGHCEAVLRDYRGHEPARNRTQQMAAYQAGRAARLLGRNVEAIAFFEQFLGYAALDGNQRYISQRAIASLGALYVSQEQTAKAITLYRAYLQNVGTESPAGQAIGRLLAELQNQG